MTAMTLTQHARVAGASYEVDHLGIAVPDLDAATRFYRDVLGCPVSAPVCPQDQGIAVVFVQFGNTRVELLSPTVELKQRAQVVSGR